MLDKQINGATFYYDSYVRLSGKSIKEPTLKCNGTVMTKFGDNTTDMYVGTLTADEITFAGDVIATSDDRYTYDKYLINKYQSSNYESFLTFSPAVDGAAFYIEPSFSLWGSVSSSIPFRPSINLKSEIQITGWGRWKQIKSLYSGLIVKIEKKYIAYFFLVRKNDIIFL